MTQNNKAYRMYFLVMYNLSSIQKGIQAGHAALEYTDRYSHTPEYKEFYKNHKTWIILDGGTSLDQVANCKYLEDYGIKYAYFIEPDLNNSISAICFLLDDTEYKPLLDENELPLEIEKQSEIYKFIKQFKLAI